MAKIQIEVGARKVQHSGQGGKAVPSGPYKVVYESDAPNDNGNLTIKVKIAEGEYEGITRMFTAGTDFSKEGNKNKWYTILRSFGYADADIPDSLELDTEEMLYGRPGFINLRAKDPNDPNSKGDDVVPIIEEDYEKILEQMAGGSEAAAEEKPAEKPKLGAQNKPAAKSEAKPSTNATPPQPAAGGLSGLKARLGGAK